MRVYQSSMSVLGKIFNVLVILKIFYYFSTKAMLVHLIKRPLTQCNYSWAKYFFNYLKVRLIELPHSQPMREGKTMLMVNHRSQADFSLHNIITHGQTNFLSRMAVAFIFPVFGIAANDTVWFFNRNNVNDKLKFNQWLDSKFQGSPRPGLLVYPEGHRMQGTETVDKAKLKTGMMRYAYQRKIPVQLMMSFGNEQVFDEKRLHVAWGQKVVYCFGQTILPDQYEDESSFVQEVKEKFAAFFDQVYLEYCKQLEVQSE